VLSIDGFGPNTATQQKGLIPECRDAVEPTGLELESGVINTRYRGMYGSRAIYARIRDDLPLLHILGKRKGLTVNR